MASDFDLIRTVHFHETDPGIRFVKDDRIAIDLDHSLDSDRILTPNVIRMPSGGYRMYYTGLGPARRVPDALGYILSASSGDAVVWRKDLGVRVDVFPPHASQRTLCPDVIPLPDGRLRMYFEARTADRPTTILSAISEDGLLWQPEPGVRFGDDTWSYGTPRCLYLENDAPSTPRLRLYFHRYTFPLVSGINAGNVIISAVSSDGLVFREEEGVRIAQETERETCSVYAPEVVRLGDGSYRMYYSGWSDEIRGGVFTATSRDGLGWTKHPDPCIDLGDRWDGDMVSEPCVIPLDDGRSRLFYEACDSDGNHRILSATTARTSARALSI